jgi:hypothetical protein
MSAHGRNTPSRLRSAFAQRTAARAGLIEVVFSQQLPNVLRRFRFCFGCFFPRSGGLKHCRPVRPERDTEGDFLALVGTDNPLDIRLVHIGLAAGHGASGLINWLWISFLNRVYTLVPYQMQHDMALGNLMARIKKRTDTSTNRESDKVIVRLPTGMRAHLADMAARRGKSMNAEVVTALAIYIAHDGDVDETTIKSSLAELKLEIKHLRDTLGWGDHEPSPQTQELPRKAKKNPPA